MAQKITTADFIKRANKTHGNKYDYSKTHYIKMHDQVAIICPEHGVFYQLATGHIHGKGCGKCAGNTPLTTEEFLSRSRDTHGDKYDYSKSEYINNTKKITIICPIHGEFKQSPHHHFQGMGCPQCGKIASGKKHASTQDEFIDKAMEIHGNRYDYSKVAYTRSNHKITIICREHGEFTKTPNKHLLGEGCPKCSGKYRRTAEEFFKEARKVHGIKYDYSKSEYLSTKHKITIICPSHGEFVQLPESHLTGSGCPRCAGNFQLSIKVFIKRANQVHDSKYDYSKTVYSNMKDVVTVICPQHGEFKQTAENHLTGSGCQKCGRNYRMNTADFIERAKEIHGEKYDYSKSKYIRAADKLTIICPIHGEFKQKPNHHLAGIGCSSCAHYGINTHESGVLYYVRVDTRTHTFWKIGITNRSVEARFRGSDLKKISQIKIWEYEKLSDALTKEQKILKQHIKYLYPGPEQPLAAGGNTELFTRDVLELDTEFK